MKVIILIALFGFAAAAVNRHINAELNEDWEAYKTKHTKEYENDAEELLRRSIWEKNLKKIQHHNIRYSLGEVSYTLGMNKYGDLTNSEFVEMLNGYKQSDNVDKSNRISFLPPLNAQVPAAVDWRTKGYVTEVKDQGQCGSCWAFSATGSLEGQWFHKTGKLIPLSEQNLVDCSQDQGNEGCNGGLMDQAFTYIKEKGIESEKAYPYEAEDDTCRYTPSKKVASDTGFVDIDSGNESALVAAIASVGPISVAIDASQDSFQLYSSGVYDEPACSSTELDHGVLAVGYDTDSTGGDYYIVKNSWGSDWGQKGYIWMSRGKDNQCGIATASSYPTV
jgi:cathepsin L